MKDLKQRTIRGGFAKICSQGANFLLRMGSLMIMARLLDPKDFGLVGMVTAVIGVFSVFRDFGLSAAAVQRTSVTEEQSSTLFWINLLVGAVLGLLALAMAPFVVAFYHEQRLFGVTAVLATAFLFNAAGVQHTALLERRMRFTALSIIDICSLSVSTAIGIGMATHGFGYWALVVNTTVTPLVCTICLWLTTRWVPGRPRKQVGIRSMMRFGGTLTLNGLVMYIASNLDKVLLGRFWGVDALGIYGRAYQLINIPTDNLNFAAGEVAFSALSRLQDDPSRLKRYFLAGYSVVLALTFPMTVACALFADDMIFVVLGPKWSAAAPIFRLLAPTILVFAIANPLFWLLSSLGLVERSLKMGLVIAPLMILSYVVALPYGPRGVAFAYSTVMLLWVLPAIAWTVHGTVISVRDMLLTVSRPLASSLVAGAFAFGVQRFCVQLPPLSRLALESAVLLITFVGMLLFVTGQKVLYLDLLRGLKGPISGKEEQRLVSA